MKYPILLLTLFASLTYFCGCTVAANYPTPQTPYQAYFAQQDTTNNLLTRPGFSVKTGVWFDPDTFDAKMVEGMDKANMPERVREQFYQMLPKNSPAQVQMKTEIKAGKSAFCSLIFDIKPGVAIDFQAGGLILTLRNPQGQVVEVRDRGCLFARYKGMQATCYDSALATVRFTRGFNNVPGTKNQTNMLFVRLDPEYNNWALLSLRLDPKRISS